MSNRFWVSIIVVAAMAATWSPAAGQIVAAGQADAPKAPRPASAPPPRTTTTQSKLVACAATCARDASSSASALLPCTEALNN